MPLPPNTPSEITIDDAAYVLTFAEEFSEDPAYYAGHNVDGVWATSYAPHLHDGRWAEANGEGQYFTDPDQADLPEVFDVADGAITITATPLTPEQQALADGQAYSSGILTTELSFAASSGYIEIRADVPDEQGFLSAFFLLPEDGDWSAEIDVFEILGNDADTLYTNVWNDGVDDSEAFDIAGLSDGYHTYGLLWTEDTIEWYVDGVLVRTEPNTIDEPMYLATALIVDSTWTGNPDETTDFSDGLSIDYIHVYELESDPDRNEAIADQSEFTPKTFVNGDSGGVMYGTRWGDVMDGLAGDDILYGRDGDDLLSGGTGQDSLYGDAGGDSLSGGADRDKLIGGDGDDFLEGGAGVDHLWGGDYSAGSGSDTFVFSEGDGMDFIHDFSASDDVIDLSAYASDLATLDPFIHDRGWATEINLSGLTGNSGDRVFIIGLDPDDLGADNFDFGLIA
ncbi:glycoside hydrolase family protein [Actibacterium atlanticum]|uniref:Glycoside hydrolase family protein n=1 Tax=Actibacterium atlanticum TaxID=1461693 RepID=A0A058ZQI5_9RHOB|nr:family 16 glycosylhydrolase [Actibacterium atlanticum]KCV83824.1 glycoside hydrolase family protein [Actibacterium atlanticum]